MKLSSNTNASPPRGPYSLKSMLVERSATPSTSISRRLLREAFVLDDSFMKDVVVSLLINIAGPGQSSRSVRLITINNAQATKSLWQQRGRHFLLVGQKRRCGIVSEEKLHMAMTCSDQRGNTPPGLYIWLAESTLIPYNIFLLIKIRISKYIYLLTLLISLQLNTSPHLVFIRDDKLM